MEITAEIHLNFEQLFNVFLVKNDQILDICTENPYFDILAHFYKPILI